MNKLEKFKDEFIKRYRYLEINKDFILSPIIPFIYLRFLKEEVLENLEILLLENIDLENNKGYLFLENLKQDKKYMKEVKKGVLKKDRYNKKCKYIPVMQCKPNVLTILVHIYTYIENQKFDIENKRRKLEVIDEYIRLAKYKNDGKIWSSGRYITGHDLLNMSSEWCATIPGTILKEPQRITNGVFNNEFINAFSNTRSVLKDAYHFSELEKQNVYLEFHDEISCDLFRRQRIRNREY